MNIAGAAELGEQVAGWSWGEVGVSRRSGLFYERVCSINGAMSPPSFTLRLNVSGDQAVVAAWVALKCSAWAMYQAKIAAAMCQAAGTMPSRQNRLVLAHDAFTQVVEELPTNDPFGDELLRYYDEVVVHLIKDPGDETPKWVN